MVTRVKKPITMSRLIDFELCIFFTSLFYENSWTIRNLRQLGGLVRAHDVLICAAINFNWTIHDGWTIFPVPVARPPNAYNSRVIQASNYMRARGRAGAEI